ncbi:hypothetical protein HS125_13910 [bacterium]|nr:hypothetical protein [bacterium]
MSERDGCVLGYNLHHEYQRKDYAYATARPLLERVMERGAYSSCCVRLQVRKEARRALESLHPPRAACSIRTSTRWHH